MKTFETPVVEVKKFYVEDILTASSGFACGPQDLNNNGCYRDFNGLCGGDECDFNTEGPED